MSEREKLEKWAWALLEEKNTLGESLLRYALAWKDDLDRAAIAQPPQTSESTLDFKSISLDALASFRCTQDPASYAKDHWSNRLLAILAEEKVNKPAEHPGCDRCNHPLYAGTHCKNCGKVHGPSEPWQPISTAPRIQGTELFVKSDYGSLHPEFGDCCYAVAFLYRGEWLEIFTETPLHPTHWMLPPKGATK